MDAQKTEQKIYKAFDKYYQDIRLIFSSDETIRRVITVIVMSYSESKDKAFANYKKYHSIGYEGRFGWYDVNDKVSAIKEIIDVMNYYGIDYPPIPESIKECFV